MEVSNSKLFFSQKKDLNSMEFDFLVTPSFDDPRQREDDGISSSPDSDDKESKIVQENQEEDECRLMVSSSTLGSSKEFKSVQSEEALEEVDDGFKTPTSLENKIPQVLKCPSAPKKPKFVPLSKRKCPARRRVLLDLSNEIESLFPPDVLKDLIGGKIKKARKQSDAIL